MLRRGDTLIEVTLAIGIFSMIAIAITAVLSSGTSGAQTALESTLAREEIDTQAEALRYIHTAYNVSKNDQDSKYQGLWQEITKKAISVNDNQSDSNSILQYSPASCEEAYKPDYISRNAFVINPRALGNFDSNENVIITGDKLKTAMLYPRLIFGTKSTDEDSLLAGATADQLFSAEGIYVLAVKDSGTTDIVTSDGKTSGSTSQENQSAFYDFFIRTCWYGAGANEPSTISTIVRLNDPDAVQVAQFGEVKITYNHNELITVSDIKVTLSTPEKLGWKFAGWCSGTVNANGTCTGKIYQGGETVTNPDLNNPLNLTLTPIWKNEYTIRYRDGNSTLATQKCTQTPSSFSCNTRGSISSPNHSSNNYTQTGWCKSNTQNCPAGNKVGFNTSVGVSSFNSQNILDLYALWQDKTFTINYNSNGGSGIGSNTCTMSNLRSSNCRINNNRPSRTGYNFKGWCVGSVNGSSCSGTTYQPGSPISATTGGSSITLTAIWEIQMFWVDVNPIINGVTYSSGQSGFLFSVSINGKEQGAFTDYYQQLPYGTRVTVYGFTHFNPPCSQSNWNVTKTVTGTTEFNPTWQCY